MRTNAAVTIPVPRVLTSAFFPYAVFVLAVALLFGGGARQALISDAIVELIALPLFACALFRLAPGRLDRTAQLALVLAAAVIALPVLQLIPLPPALWSALPGRGKIAEGYQVAGINAPWLPISLDPAATWRSLLSLIPGVAVFLAALSLDQWERRILIMVVLAVAALAVPLGFFQIMGADGLYFYAITNEGMAVGFFANGNHNATFLNCAIPFAAAAAIGLFTRRERNTMALWLLIALLALLVVGVAIVGSRAGLGLAFAAGVLCVAMVYRSEARASRRMLFVALAGFAVATTIAAQFVFAGWEKRNVQGRDLLTDLRWEIAGVTLSATKDFLPVGSGLGTFQAVYEMSSPRTQVFDRYVNHAHDDWLELTLEGGLPALVVLAAFLAWFVLAAWRAWRDPRAHGLDPNFARAGSIAALLPLLHSTVDYPMRSIAITVVFALSCALLLQPAAAERSADERPR